MLGVERAIEIQAKLSGNWVDAVPNLDAMSKQEIENLIRERFGDNAPHVIRLLEEVTKDPDQNATPESATT